jgi:hypothetical protein
MLLGSRRITIPLALATPAAHSASLTERPASHRRASTQKLDGPPNLLSLTSTFPLLTNDAATLEKIPTLAMKIPRHRHKLSTVAGLLVLAVGFTSLGFLSFISRHPEDAANGLFTEATYSIVGSLISILVGATFLAIAVLFTGRLRRRKSQYALGWFRT